jgi:DNA-binding CsgD family transcriptional regulator
MFAAREDGMSNAEIARRFGCDAGTVTRLIGPRPVTE